MQIFVTIILAFLSLSVKAANTDHFPEHVYVLSLDRTPARYKEADENLNKSKIPHSRFSASDGYELKIKDLLTKKHYTGRSMWSYCMPQMKNPNKSQPSKFLFEVNCDEDPRNNIRVTHCRTPGEIGVYCSMKRIWRDIYDKGYKTALILEDDSRILPKYKNSFKKNVSKIVANTPLDWDVIFLHLYYKHEKTYPARKIGSKEQNEFVWGINKDPTLDVASCAAYIVNRSFVTRLLPFSDIMDLPIDLDISKAINAGVIKAYKAKEKLILPDEKELHSVISAMGRNSNGDLK